MKAPFSPLVKRLVRTKEDIKIFYAALDKASDTRKEVFLEIGGEKIIIKEIK